MNDFAVFILTYGRANAVYTYDTLIKCNYTGDIYIVCSDDDKQLPLYQNKYKNKVVSFTKTDYVDKFDMLDNFEDMRVVVYARNAIFNIAKSLSVKSFLVLDDDYNSFDYRLFTDVAIFKPIKNINEIFSKTITYLKSINALTIAYAQGGDFIGGIDNGKSQFRFSQRKAMNTFFCLTERPFSFIGRINEDVNAYIYHQSTGNLFLTIQNLSITQKATQKNKGGLTDIYLDSGTYVKSFYTVICNPSCVCVRLMNANNRRLHHSINWDCAVPQIISEKYKLSCKKVAED